MSQFLALICGVLVTSLTTWYGIAVSGLNLHMTSQNTYRATTPEGPHVRGQGLGFESFAVLGSCNSGSLM